MKIEIYGNSAVHLAELYLKFEDFAKRNEEICKCLSEGKPLEMSLEEHEIFNEEYDKALETFGLAMAVALKYGGLKCE